MDKFVDRLIRIIENMFNGIFQNAHIQENLQALLSTEGISSMLATAVVTMIVTMIRWRVTGRWNGQGCIGGIGLLIVAFVFGMALFAVLQIVTGLPLKVYG